MDFLYPADTGQYAAYYVDPFLISNGDLEYHQVGSVLSDGGDTYGVTSVVYDKYEELFWMGNQGGHVTSYYGPTMQRYTSFQIHANEEVRTLLTIDSGILALTKSTLKLHIRRGLPKFTYKSSNMLDMQCLLTMDNHRIIIGGHQNKLIDFDLNRIKEISQHLLGTLDSKCAILRRNNFMLATGDPCGKITLHDPNSLRSQHVLDTHSASLSDFDIQDNLLVSCGFSMNGGILSCDCFLLAYDIRTLKPLPPYTVCCEPLLLRFVPPTAGHLATVASQGRVQLLNTCHVVQPRLNLFQVNTQNSHCLTFDVSSTGQSLIFGDQAGHLHLYSLEQSTDPIFNQYSRDTEFADTPEEIPSVSITDDSFLVSSIPMPSVMSKEKLLSNWPGFLKRGYRQPKPIDPEILKNMKMQGPIGCAPNPRTALRNQIPYILEQHINSADSKSLENSINTHITDNDSNSFVSIPKRYRKVEIRYSKLGSHDFDFEHYNKTGFPGLEANLPNSYCNSMLQILYYTNPIKKMLAKHMCNREFCLSCELGFLFRMLDTSLGAPCQASNFLRAFRTVPEASALGLILNNNPESRSKTNLASLIQSWNRFILHQMHYEILEIKKKEMEMNLRDHDFSTRSLSDKINLMSINSTYNNQNHTSYWDEFSFNESEFPEIGKKNSKKGVESEEKDDFNMIISQDEGKYMWLSPSALPNTTEIYDSLDFNLISPHSHTNEVKKSNQNAKTLEENSPSIKKCNSEETEISHLFGTKQLQIHKCLKCNREEHKESIVLLCNLQYPSHPPAEFVSFSDLLKNSLCPKRNTPAWCENCRRFTPTLQCCSVKQLPNLLAINCGLTSSNDKTFWQNQMDNMVALALGHVNDKYVSCSPSSLNNKPCRYGNHCSRPGCKFKHPEDKGQSPPPSSLKFNHSSNRSLHQLYIQNPWLPHEIEAQIDADGNLTIKRTDSNHTKLKNDVLTNCSTNTKIRLDQNGITNSDACSSNSHSTKIELNKQYMLGAVVCYVDDVQKNIVSFIKINSDGNRTSQPQWFLFNDFCVSPVTSAEVTWFNLEWKVPCVLFYYNKNTLSKNSVNENDKDTIWNNDPGITIPASRIFFDDGRVAASSSFVTFTPLSAHEMPKRGELVGMDAEFVTLNQEEAELKSDGRLSTIRPSHFAVARITCIRGQGPMEGTPFIDDYISTQEQVVDYLTKFSGIKPGDLDANFSSKHLTTLKSTYRKLRFLVDTGVIFVGHGLSNDFRVINLVVPSDQIIDTVQLFHLPHHRMVSLKFLAWHVLGTKIQSDTHDSIEDARTALQLYKRYLELKAKGAIPSTLASLYKTGKALNWKAPND